MWRSRHSFLVHLLLPLNHNSPKVNIYNSMFLPICSPRLVENRCVTEGIAEDEGVNSRRLVSVFSKFLSQKASQRCPKQMDLIIHKHKADPKTLSCFNFCEPQNMPPLPSRLKRQQQLEKCNRHLNKCVHPIKRTQGRLKT